MKILVTGGAGYIGSHVVKQLAIESKYNVTVLDNLSTGHQQTIDSLSKMFQDVSRFVFIKAELSDFKKVSEILKNGNFDAILHFAASIVVPESVENPMKYYLNNTVNTANLINECINNSINNFVFSSTASVYGEPTEIPIKETTPKNPINPYGSSKLMSETILQDAKSANENFNYVILRYFNVAGADIENRIGQSFPNSTHLIKIAAQTALAKRDGMSIFGDDYDTPDGTCLRDYIHIDDLADAHVKSLEYMFSHKKSNIFNCGYGHGFSVNEVIATMKSVTKIDFDAKFEPRRAGDPSILISDNTKIKNELNWSPKYDDLEVICKTAFDWESKI